MSISEIDVEQLADELRAGATVIDVREPDEFAEARVPGARHIPLGDVPNHIDEFAAVEPTYVICRSGGRSLAACELVAAARPDATVINVAGGTMAWIASGYDVDRGDSEPPMTS